MKVCTKCKEEKILNEFYKHVRMKDGLSAQCKSCINLTQKEYRTRPEIIEYNKRYHKEYRKTDKYQTNHSYGARKEYMKAYDYSRERKDIRNARRRERWNTDPIYKLRENERSRIRNTIRYKRINKTQRLDKYLGCSIQDLKKHLESLFQPGMTWENFGYGEGKWNIDHKTPLALGNTEEELIKLCNYTNLQPLWHKDHIKKTKSDISAIYRLK